MRRAVTLLALLPLGACVVGPNYREPPTPPAGAFREAAPPPDEPLPPNWWQLYDDPALDDLVKAALAANTDLRVAAANLQRARAVLREVGADRLPTTELSGGIPYGRGASATRGTLVTGSGSGGVGNGGDTTGSGNSAGQRTGFIFSGAFTLNYEIDLFGRITRSIQAARADYDYTAATQDAVRVTVAADTTAAYLDVCTLGRRIDIANASVALIQQSYDITRKQVDLGANDDFALAQVGVLLDQTRAVAPQLEAQRQASLYGLAVLTGRPPAEVSSAAAACRTAPKLRIAIPSGDGAALLRRRPDVRAAERTLAADVARIGVATADLYPTISLGATVSAQGTGAGSAFSRSGTSFGIGPLITWFIPNFVAARARVVESRAQASASLAHFDGTVLTALKEAEQSLVTYSGEIKRNAALGSAQRNARRELDLSGKRLTFGSISQLEQITVQRDVVTAEQALADSDATLAADQVAVFRALGGGWEQAPAIPVRSAAAEAR